MKVYRIMSFARHNPAAFRMAILALTTRAMNSPSVTSVSRSTSHPLSASTSMCPLPSLWPDIKQFDDFERSHTELDVPSQKPDGWPCTDHPSPGTIFPGGGIDESRNR